MSWIRKNNFLAVFLLVTALCTIALGVLLYFQYDKYSTVAEEYSRQTTELKELQSLPLYPSEDNLKKLRVQKQGLDDNIARLKAKLATMALPVPDTTPEGFQDRLRASVISILDQARQNNVKMPEKFYLGFDGYQSQPPKREVTMRLANQMAGLEFVIKCLIDNRVSQIDSVNRTLFPEEDSKAISSTPTAGKAAQPANMPLTKTSFVVAFKGEQSQLRKFLNSIAESDKQFFVIRSLQIKNEKPKAPSKLELEDVRPSLVGSDPMKTGTSESSPSLKFILGTEKIDVVAQIEIVNFKPIPGK